MIGYISIGSYRIKGDDWQSHPLREVVSTVPLYEFRSITSIHHIIGSVKNISIFLIFLLFFKLVTMLSLSSRISNAFSRD